MAAPAPAPAPLPPVSGEPETRPRIGLIIAGAATFGASYLSGVFVYYLESEIDDDPETTELLVPVLGPLLLLDDSDDEATGYLILDSIAQAAGLTMLAIGLFYPAEVAPRASIGARRLAIRPMVGPRMTGASLSLSL